MLSTLKEQYKNLNTLESWRDWLIDVLSLIYVIIFPLVVIPLIPYYLKHRYYVVIVADIAVWLVLLIRTLIPSLGYRFRGMFWIAMLYCLTITFFVVLGPSYARPVWMIVSIIMIAVFFGSRAAVIGVILNALMLLALYFIMDHNDRNWVMVYREPFSTWLNFIITSTMLLLLGSLSVGFLINRLSSSLEKERRTKEELTAAMEELEATNEEFEAQNEELIRSEAEISQKESFIRRIMENAPAAVFRLSLDTWELQYVNSRAMHFMHLSSDRPLTGRDVFEHVVPDDWKDTLRVYWKGFLKGTREPVIRYPILRENGGLRWIEQRCVIVDDDDGVKTAIEGFCTDISQEMESFKAIRSSEEKYRTLVESIGEALFTVDSNGILTYISPGLIRFGNFIPEEIIGKPFLEFIHPDDHDKIVRRFNELTEGIEVPADYRIISSAGDIRWVQSTSRPHFSNGNFTGLSGILTDIHARRLVEEELRQSQMTLESLVNALPEPAFLIDDDRKFLAVNSALSIHLGKAPEELIGKYAYDMITPLIPGKRPTHIDRSFIDGKPAIYEDSHEDRFYMNYIYPVLNEAGKVIRVAFFALDITDRKRAEVKLLQEKVFITTVLDTLPGIFFMLDEEGSFIRWKGIGKNTPVFGYSPEEVWNMHAVDLLDDDDKEIFGAKTRQVFRDGYASSEFTIRSKEGVKSIYFISGSRMELEGEKFLICIGVDITGLRSAEIERERTRLQLIQAQKMEAVGTLAGGIAHDFNNMLGGIMGSINMLELLLLEEGRSSREAMLKYIEIAFESCKRAADMTSQLLTISRKSELKLAPVDINLSMKHIYKLIKNSFPKSVEIDFNIGDTPLTIMADPVQIEQVILNLCVNASQAMTLMRPDGERHGGKMHVEAGFVSGDEAARIVHAEVRPGTNYAKITVSDNGVGMSDEIRAHIFDPFFTTKKSTEGTGLGLSMVYSIVRQHGGFIDVHSEPGNGSIFTVFIPSRDADSPGPVAQKIKPGVVRGGGTILIIDDEKAILRIARGMLELCGYQVLTADNGPEGIEIYLREHEGIDGVLMDLSMPGTSGLEVYESLKDINRDVRVLLTSGLIDDYELSAAKERGIRDFIQKPFTAEDLSRRIRDLLA